MNTDSAPPAGASPPSASQFAPAPSGQVTGLAAEVPSLGAPPPLSAVQSDGISLGGAMSSSPAGSGAGSAAGTGGPVPAPVAAAVLLTTHVTPILDAFEAQLAEQFASLMLGAKNHVDTLVADFEAALASGHTEIAAITDELRHGGIVGRLGGVEMALASHAAPALFAAGHDGHDLLAKWFAGIKSTFDRVVAGVVQDKADAAAAAAGVPAPVPPPAPAPVASPATAQIAAMGIPQFQPPPRL